MTNNDPIPPMPSRPPPVPVQETVAPSQTQQAPDKELEKPDELQTQAKAERQSQAIIVHFGLNVMSLCTCLVARPQLVIPMCAGGAAEAASRMSVWTSTVGLTEFLLNPFIGDLSDRYGRKPFLLLSPTISFLLKLRVWKNPTIFNLAIERILCGAAATLSGTTTSSAALSDIFSDSKALSMSFASLGSAAGLGVMIGPVIGGFAMRRGGGPHAAMFAAAMVSAAQACFILAMVEETMLPERKSKPTTRKGLKQLLPNPMSMAGLFNKERGLTTLISVAAIQCCCEGKVISDTNAVYLTGEANMTPEARSWWTTCFGLSMTLAGRFARKSIAKLGQRGHTTLANYATLVGFLIIGATPKPLNVWGALPFFVLSMERRAATSALADKRAVALGMGRGEFSGAFANLRALVVALAPMIYAIAYAKGKPLGRPGLGYWVGGIIALIAELILRTAKDEELGIQA